MLVNDVPYHSIWRNQKNGTINIIDQRWLPHEFSMQQLSSTNDAMVAIRDMWVRGAPLIGVTAAYGMAIAMAEDPSQDNLQKAGKFLNTARPTAVNLFWAVSKMQTELIKIEANKRASAAMALADQMAEEDVQTNMAIGKHGAKLIANIAQTKTNSEPVRILTHCNAGWLATVDRGTATAPIYEAHEQGIPIEVWVDETRPRNQGAALTTWELLHNHVPHTLIVDNAGGHLMQQGLVDICIVGSDRTTATGDVCNKIGTYLKALAAKDNGVPFYAALPKSTIDFALDDGIRDIPIENRSEEEVTHIQGLNQNNEIVNVRLCPDNVRALNPAFDLTPRHFITRIITEYGVHRPDQLTA
ncbi:S-methyl-5-thioribose-1-phosphate isomerase [Alphaproteobacteria bacterium]|nr:S-methyl-5-thioribose-1-phosphate isomerase [Alphaproteobacteria bacterium]